MKRVLIFLILFSMILHCSVRLGFVTWLYQNRQEIAYSFGFIEALPITVCSHEQDLDRAVTINVSHDESDKLPAGAFHTREIILFADVYQLSPVRASHSFISVISNCVYLLHDYSDPGLSIFQPPKV